MSQIKITPQLLDRLRGLAQNCQPPIWEIDEDGDVVSSAHMVADCGFLEDAEFIAAADPATVLALVEEIAILRRALQELTWDLCGIDLEQEQIDKICNEWIQKAKMLIKSEAGQ